MTRLHAVEGGSAGPRIVLIHGLGATGRTWEPVIALLGERCWLAPDLRGHGRSPHAPPYGYAAYAADIAGLLEQGEEVVVVGHSMGGVIGMLLASGWFGVTVVRLIAAGVKASWLESELERMQDLARRPQRVFATRAQAITQYLKVAGLNGILDPAGDAAASGIAERDGGWGLAADPLIYAGVTGEVDRVPATARCPVRLGAGEHDPMVSVDQLRPFDPDPFVVAGAGHNAPAERPGEFWQVVERELDDLR